MNSDAVLTDVAVLGAGAIGLTIAYELARRGRTVTLVDRDPLAAIEREVCTIETPPRSATSWAASGILPPANLETATDPIEQLRGLSHRLFPGLVDRLIDETGIDPHLVRCGGWYLSDTIGETASMVGMASYWRDLSIECHETDLAELAIREPALESWTHRASVGRAWWVPDEYQICTPLYLQALIEACRKLGVTMLDETCVDGIDEHEKGATISIHARHVDAGHDGERAPHGRHLQAEQTVLCGGVWSGLISDRLKLAQSLVPVRGQILLLKTDAPILSSVINLGQRYLVPRRDGAILVGSCEEEVGFQHGTTPKVLSELRQFVRELCPQLQSARELAAWSGLRPLTFDGFPMCGKVPGSDSVFVAAGHFRSGIHLSPGTAVCMADMVCGVQPQVDMVPFAVGKQQHHHLS
ncbi:MAG: FAD-dependent oxidoreductase [Planctomycetales bacterium]|nr:FAD-dependent oxidoreductase [Planctomycetales bacterium]